MKEYFWNKDVFLRLGRAIPTEQSVAWDDLDTIEIDSLGKE